MHRLFRALGVVVTVTLVGYAVWLMWDSDVDAVVEDAIADGERAEGEQEVAERARERLRLAGRGGLALSRQDPDDDSTMPEDAVVSTVPYGSGEIDDQTARDGFDHAMGNVEAIIKARRRVSLEEWDSLYREANDAFAALSIVLDAADEAQVAELEEAHKRLKAGLKKVRVRGKKLAH